MTVWIALLSLAVLLTVLAVVAQARRDGRREELEQARDERDKRWEQKIDTVLRGFEALERIVTGAIKQRTGIDRDLADHETRIRKLEEWQRVVKEGETH